MNNFSPYIELTFIKWIWKLVYCTNRNLGATSLLPHEEEVTRSNHLNNDRMRWTPPHGGGWEGLLNYHLILHTYSSIKRKPASGKTSQPDSLKATLHGANLSTAYGNNGTISSTKTTGIVQKQALTPLKTQKREDVLSSWRNRHILPHHKGNNGLSFLLRNHIILPYQYSQPGVFCRFGFFSTSELGTGQML